MDNNLYLYKATITNVVDGDTFDATVDVGFKTYMKHRFRLKGIDTPETWRPKTEAERLHGEKATLRVKELVENREVFLVTYKAGIYDRWIAEVFIDQDCLDRKESLSDILINEGFSKLESYQEE